MRICWFNQRYSETRWYWSSRVQQRCGPAKLVQSLTVMMRIMYSDYTGKGWRSKPQNTSMYSIYIYSFQLLRYSLVSLTQLTRIPCSQNTFEFILECQHSNTNARTQVRWRDVRYVMIVAMQEKEELAKKPSSPSWKFEKSKLCEMYKWGGGTYVLLEQANVGWTSWCLVFALTTQLSVGRTWGDTWGHKVSIEPSNVKFKSLHAKMCGMSSNAPRVRDSEKSLWWWKFQDKSGGIE